MVEIINVLNSESGYIKMQLYTLKEKRMYLTPTFILKGQKENVVLMVVIKSIHATDIVKITTTNFAEVKKKEKRDL